jgi:hypothetical protein
MKKITFALFVTFALFTGALAQDAGDKMKQGVKSIGKGAKDVGTATAEGAKTVTKKTVRGTKKVTRKTVKGTKKGIKKVGEGTEKVGEKMKKAGN